MGLKRNVEETLKTITTADLTGGTRGGLMQPEQVMKFIDLTLEYSSMLSMVRVEKKTRNRGELDTLNVGSVVTEGAVEEPGDGTSPAEEVEPTFGKLEFTLVKLRSLFDITTETLKDNIEAEAQATQHGGLKGEAPAGDFRDTLIKAYAKRVSSDLELQAIQGDDTIVSTASKLNRLLKVNAGWDQITDTGTHLVDIGHLNVSAAVFTDMLEAMPAPYLKRIGELRWFMGPRTWIRWMRVLSSRETQAGDKAIEGDPLKPMGIPIEMIPLIPEDKESVVGTTTYDSESFIWLTFPQNFIWVVRRQFEVYWEFVPRRDKWENTTYSETDQLVENPDAIVKATNLKVDAPTAYS